MLNIKPRGISWSPCFLLLLLSSQFLDTAKRIGVFAVRDLPDEVEESSTGPYHKAFPVVEPDDSHTKLSLSQEGLEAIARIKEPIAVVAVIGPYRSGKSFLLNQLLSLSCDEGFGVGHLRDTKTKGVWVWGEPTYVEVNGQRTAVLFFDTEGFESVGKSSVYDDRIFALAAILSSVLVYNLPETVREADIAKLSFAVELAQEFYGRVKGRDAIFTPAKLLWLIQRDFLEGKTVQEMVDASLRPVPNPDGDRDVDQINMIRWSLALMAQNSTAFGLVQPHLARTKLCQLSDSDLEPKYLRQRKRLQKLVRGLAAPKIVSGRSVNGQEFVGLLKQTLDALNKGKIPSAGSVVDAFNRAVVEKCMDMYGQEMGKLQLPGDEKALLERHKRASEDALRLFEHERFGRKSLEEASKPLQSEIQEALSKLQKENAFLSAQHCEKTYANCEDLLDSLTNMRLPSMAKFDAGLNKCNETVRMECKGPSTGFYEDRMSKMWTRERAQFLKDYNTRLFNFLVLLSLLLVVVGRFIVKWTVIEVLAWAAFVFLETYTRVFWSADALYYNPMWRGVVTTWEAVVYNPVIDLDLWAIPLAWATFTLLLLCRCLKWRKRAHSHSHPHSHPGGSLLPIVGGSPSRRRD